MGNSYLNEELTKMLFSIYESITEAKNMYENLPSVIKQNANYRLLSRQSATR